MNRIGAVVSLVSVVVGACEPSVADRISGDLDANPRRVVSDGATGGNAHFYFLPPLVPAPAFSGSPDPSLMPTVEVCDAGVAVPAATTPCGNVVAAFSAGGGVGDDIIGYDAANQRYHVNWDTDRSDQSVELGHYYRISVSVAGTRLGYADVTPVSGKDAVRNPRTGDVIPLSDGRTLPLKFRIEEGAVAVVGAAGGTTHLADGAVALSFPAGALDGEIGVTASPVPADAPGSDIGVLPGTLFEFQPSPISFDEPVTLTIAIPATLPPHVRAERLVLCRMTDGACVPVPGSNASVVDRTVSGQVVGFSEYAIREFPEILRYRPAFQDLSLRTAAGEVPLVSSLNFEPSELSWSPEGEHFVYIAGSEIRRVTVNGAVQTVLRSGECVHYPDWSKVGDRIVYQVCQPSELPGRSMAIYSIRSDGSDRRSYPAALDRSGMAMHPRWSPDGQWIAYRGRTESGAPCLCVISADGTEVRALDTSLESAIEVEDIAWSPDGTRLAFHAWDVGTDEWGNWTDEWGIWAVNFDGSGLTLIARSNFNIGEPVFLGGWGRRDGVEVVLYCICGDDLGHEEYGPGTHTVLPDGTGTQRVGMLGAFASIGMGRDPARLAGSVWQPSGGRNIWVFNIDGSGGYPLAPGADFHESIPFWWRP